MQSYHFRYLLKKFIKFTRCVESISTAFEEKSERIA
jgi:hypothetical protein